MRTNSFRLLTFICALGFYACDRWGFYKYEVTNLTKSPIKVEFVSQYDSSAILTINPNETILVYRDRTGTLGKNEKPRDIYTHVISDFKSLRISVNDKPIDKDFRIRSNWTYKSIDREFGLYSLTVDSITIKN